MSLLDLAAKITLDASGYNKGMKEAEGKASSFGSKLKTGLAAGAKVAVAGLTAVSGAIVKISKDSVEAYANYEQLVGGVETLFKGSADVVQGYAENAYKTAGLSANEYMQTVTSFSAALINSVGGDTQKAAQLSNMAITDMADNANKMGTSLESLQNAYTGFSRGNFTMLDNLALGFSGTKEGMQQLLDKAEELSGVKYDISSYADMVEAIHVIQTEMGITGTTAKEASETIQGSIAMTKSAWQNLLVGFADPKQDLGKLIDNLVSSVTTALGNISERIMVVLPNISQGITKLFESLLPIIITLIQTMFPDLLKGAVDIATSLFTALIENLPTIIDNLVAIMPQIIEAAIALILALSNGIAENLPVILPSIMGLILEMVRIIYENLPLFIESAQKIIAGLIEGFVNSIPDLLLSIGGIVATIWEGFQQIKPLEFLKGVGEQITEGLWEGIVSAKDWILGKIKEFIGDVTSGLKSFFGIQDLDTSITTPDVAKYEIKHSVVSPNPETLPEYQLNKSIQELNATMKNGDAKVNIENTRDVRRAVNA